jgi:Ca2+-binding RTX toxin-like protein
MAFVEGTAAADWINAADGVTDFHDEIRAYGGNDFIFGLGGSDDILGGAGADYIDGGAGADYAEYYDSWEGVVVSLVTGEGFGGTAEGDTLVNIENLWGSVHADWLIGNNGINWLYGDGGNDLLDGGLGDDILTGGGGDDTLKGGGGADTLEGNTGIDTASYNGSSAGVVVSLISDYADGGDATGDELNGVENLTGSAYADNLWGDGGANVLRGMNGNDTLKGFGGADRLFGGNGNDLMIGGTGFMDIMNGEAGADTFKFATLAECGLTAASADQLSDFSEASGDKIDLSAMDANTLLAGNQAFTWIGNDNAFTGVAGELRYMTSGYVEGDVDGDAVSDFYIAVNNVLTPVMHDFGFVL